MTNVRVQYALLLMIGTVAVAGSAEGQNRARPADGRREPVLPERTLNAVYRPSIMIVNGSGRGSGTIIASVPNETLVLTAAHVVRAPGALQIELEPYNLGLERDPARAVGEWPRRVPAEVAAIDEVADVAVLRVRGMVGLPYVARVALLTEEPKPGAILTSAGVDAGGPLTGWRTDVRGTAQIDIGKGEKRPFTLTTKPPEPGRSGGGLFLEDGAIVGVCVGRLQIKGLSGELGVFASIQSIRQLLQTGDLQERIEHSAAWRRLFPQRRQALPLERPKRLR